MDIGSECQETMRGQMQSIVVTGGAGFIGANFVRWLLSRSDAGLVIIDKLTYAGHLLNIQSVLDESRVKFIEADIADRTAMSRIFVEHRPQAVVNFAAESHVDRSIDSPAPFVETNTVGTFVLLEEARQYWKGLSEEKKWKFRLLHVSTDEVYGTLGADGLFSEENTLCTEFTLCSVKGCRRPLRTSLFSIPMPCLLSRQTVRIITARINFLKS